MSHKSCAWTSDEDGVWYTSCGHAHEFMADGPVENHYQFCPYCGGSLEVDERWTLKKETKWTLS